MKTFAELGLTQPFLRALNDLGFEFPMPVQEEVIPVLMQQDTDLVALAQTGTGKTAAYGFPLIHRLDLIKLFPQILILCPTRELCVQIAGDLVDYAKYVPEVKILPVYGGSSIELQIRSLKKGIHIVVATPGRLVDLINRKVIRMNQINTVVLDEADEMLTMGFSESIEEIFAQVPENRHVLLFSATMPKEVANISRQYMHKPVEITIGVKNAGAENIKHVYYLVHAKDRYLVLKRIVDFNPNIYGIIFCRTRKETQEIADKLIQDGYNAEALHGDLSQAQRDFVMQKFRIRHFRLLVATDVAARGLDVDDLTHVINFNLPDELDVYTHRSGRTGRAGKLGTSVVILHLKERHLIKQIEKKINKSFVAGKIPDGREVCEKQLFHLIDKMEKVEIDHSGIDTYLPGIFRKLEWLDKEDIIRRFVALEFNRFLDYYKNSTDLNVVEEKQKTPSWTRDVDVPDRRPTAGFVRLMIDQGKADGLYPSNLIELINANTRGKMVPVGKIDLFRDYVIFEVDANFVTGLIKSLNKTRFRGIPVRVTEAPDQERQPDRREKRNFSRDKRSFSRDKR
ncbi:MAG: DEAD/DEAH box helicase [Bacteroidetes bacterium]|nr:DEAD/DEAH box helicase [Bacteroidota bacterium]